MKKHLLNYFVCANAVLLFIITVIILIINISLSFWWYYLLVSTFGLGILFIIKTKFKILVSIISILGIIILMSFQYTEYELFEKYNVLYSIHVFIVIHLLMSIFFLIIEIISKKNKLKLVYFIYLAFTFFIIIIGMPRYKYLIDRKHYIELSLTRAQQMGIDLPRQSLLDFSKCMYGKFSERYGYSFNFSDSSNYNLYDYEVLFDCSFNYLVEDSDKLDYKSEKEIYLRHAKEEITKR